MSDALKPFECLEINRSAILFCEAIGWFHMFNKARLEFLKEHSEGHSEKNIKFGTDSEKLSKLLNLFSGNFKFNGIEGLSDFNTQLKDFDFVDNFANKASGEGLEGLLQAAHAMASGIEKQSYNDALDIKQNIANMWLTSAFGYPLKNLVIEPTNILKLSNEEFYNNITEVFRELADVGTDIKCLKCWRDSSIAFIKRYFTQTLAETRVPNNDVTLFDMSYVAAALFKSAVAGALLDRSLVENKGLKYDTKWRILTVGIGAEHYESRSIKIGDYLGASKDLNKFFSDVQYFVEVELAIGNLLYKNSSVCVFSFPDIKDENVKNEISEKINECAKGLNLETPPYIHVSCDSYRSLVKMTTEIKKAEKTLSVPLYSFWEIREMNERNGHVCPVCNVRLNGDKDKQKPCRICSERRKGRIDNWKTVTSKDTIWLDEVADKNGRLAMITMNLDIESWVDGSNCDSLRTTTLIREDKSDLSAFLSNNLFAKIENLKNINLNDLKKLFKCLNGGYRDNDEFYKMIIEDRSEDEKDYVNIKNSGKLYHFVLHQLLKKLPSPGRTYRFQRQTQDFFEDLLAKFRELLKDDGYRNKRFIVKFDETPSKELLDGQYLNNPLSVFRLSDDKFITISNMSVFKDEDIEKLKNKELKFDLDGKKSDLKFTIFSIDVCDSSLGNYSPIIPLEISPERFRIIVPLEKSEECVDYAINKWKKEFSRVIDRMPLRIGVVAFPRTVPFISVIETARNIENDFNNGSKKDFYIAERTDCDDKRCISFIDNEGKSERFAIPFKLKAGNDDLFYPYLELVDGKIENDFDFSMPCFNNGKFTRYKYYRHVSELNAGDKVKIAPSYVTTVFLDASSKRFEHIRKHYIHAWDNIKTIWDILKSSLRSSSSFKPVWHEFISYKSLWKESEGYNEEYLKVFFEKLMSKYLLQGISNAEIVRKYVEKLWQYYKEGTLEWTLEWNMNVLKRELKENAYVSDKKR